MGRFSLVKITVALIITLGYVFLFGMTGTVESIEEATESTMPPITEKTEDTTPEKSEEITVQPAENTARPEITFAEYTSLDVSNQPKPFDLNAAVTVQAGQDEVITAASTTTAETSAETTTEKDYTPIETTADTVAAITEDTSTAANPFNLDDTEYPTPTTTEAREETTPEERTETSAETSAEEDTTKSEETPSTPPADVGTLTVSYTGSGGSVTLDAADILAQVVMGEIGGSFNEEAIKAQAVAAYTYIKYYNDNGNVPYVAIRTPSEKVINCVNQVLGQGVYYNGSLIQAVYGASTAGYTASAKNVWGIDYAYLPSQKCELDALYDPNYGVKATFTSTEIKNKVREKTGIELSGDPGNWFAIREYVDNVYVGTMSIGGQTSYVNGSGETVNITGRVMREKIMDFDLRSACFEISYSADTDKFTFTTYGYGHGVGFSQHGANNLANYWNYDYKQILQFYYPGTEVR